MRASVLFSAAARGSTGAGSECVCKPGWKGKECNIRYEECEVPDCSGHGHCEDGKCVCMKVRM